MLVRQLQGGYAGQVLDMPYHVARALLDSGHACLPEESPAIKGLRVEPEVEVSPVTQPEVETMLTADRTLSPGGKKSGGRSKKASGAS